MDQELTKRTSDNEINTSLLKRKMSRKIKKINVEEKRNFNIDEYKEKVIEEIYNLNKIPKQNLEKNKTNFSTFIDYENLYRKYLQVE